MATKGWLHIPLSHRTGNGLLLCLWTCSNFIGWSCTIPRLYLYRGLRPLTRLPVGRGWLHVMIRDGILVTEQSLIWQPKRSSDLQHTILALTGWDGQLEGIKQTNRLVVSSFSTYIIVPTEFFKLHSWQINKQPYFILKALKSDGWGSVALRQQYSKPSKQFSNKWFISNRIISVGNTWNRLTVFKRIILNWIISVR